MKIYTSLFLFFSFLTLSAAEKKVTSSITEVTVYLTGAQIQRTAICNLTPGTNEILLHDLSPNIDENSIQISGLKNTSVLSINFSVNYLEKKKDSDKLHHLKIKLNSLLLEKNNLDNTITGLQQEQKLLGNNQRIGSDVTPISLESIKEISSYYRKRSTTIENTIYTTNQKINTLTKEITKLKNEINKLKDHSKEERGEIRLKLDAPSATNLALTIQYNVSNAGWFPIYDIKSKSVEDPLSIIYKANIYQQTGTDWNDVNIILSTGDPNTNAMKPELNPKYLNFTYSRYKPKYATQNIGYKYNPTIRRVSGIVTDSQGQPLPGVTIVEKGTSNGALTDFDGRYTIDIQGGRELSFSYIGFVSSTTAIHSSLMNINMEEDESALEEVVVVARGASSLRGKIKRSSVRQEKEKKEYNPTVEVKEQGIVNTRFKIKKKYTIDSNAEITVIQIDNFKMKTEYQYYVAPEVNENVFLTAKLGSWEQFNLLAGEANIYFEGSFAGKTNIDPLATTDSITISLGIDPNIVVNRKQLTNFKNKSFTGSNRIINRGYQIDIKNNKQHKISITVEDRIPVSQNKEIKLDNILTGDASYNSKTGMIQWNIDIAPNKKEQKEFSYQVKYPKNRYINL